MSHRLDRLDNLETIYNEAAEALEKALLIELIGIIRGYIAKNMFYCFTMAMGSISVSDVEKEPIDLDTLETPELDALLDRFNSWHITGNSLMIEKGQPVVTDW